MGVTVRWLPEKKAYYLFISHNGKRKAKAAGKHKAAADLAAAKIQARLILGDFNLLKAQAPEGSNGLLLEDFSERVLANHLKTGQIRETTYEEYGRSLKTYVFPVLGSRPIDSITRGDIRDLIISVMAAGKSTSLVRNLLAPLRLAFNHAVDDGLLPVNPALRMGRYMKDKIDHRAGIDFLSETEEAILLTAVKEYAPEYYCLILFALRTGARFGEIVGAQWADLDFTGRFFEVRRTLRSLDRIYPPKNGRIRRVDLSLQLIAELKRLRAQRVEETLKQGVDTPWVFVTKVGTPLNRANLVQRVLHRVLAKAGLRRIRFHDLRHTFASRLLQNGESLVYVKEQLGHSTIKVTVDVYGHLIPGANKAAVDRLDGSSLPAGGASVAEVAPGLHLVQ
jgi:integrase